MVNFKELARRVGEIEDLINYLRELSSNLTWTISLFTILFGTVQYIVQNILRLSNTHVFHCWYLVEIMNDDGVVVLIVPFRKRVQ